VPADPCILVIFGAAGDLTKRLLMPSLLNLATDGLLPERMAVVGLGREELTHESFRDRMTADVKRFATRAPFDAQRWSSLASRLHFIRGGFEDPLAYQALAALIARLDREHETQGNVLVYMATPPSVFGEIAKNIHLSGLMGRETGWTRLIVEKPFGHDLASAMALNESMRRDWSEDQLFRVDHYLGKETVQNLLAFRFANGIYEPLWNNRHIDHVQLTVAESVTVEGRGGYYDKTGVLRDMIQNHMLQMLAYLCMEPPASLRADAVRNEKAKVLEAIRIMKPEDVARDAVRGQYGPGTKPDGTPVAAYRLEAGVDPESSTETYAALRLFLDNPRWEGVPFYLRSGKALWKRGTEIVVAFRKPPELVFGENPAGALDDNKLIFHIQPEQGIEFRFLAKVPGPAMALQKVNMRFDYRDAFEAQRGTGYEVMLYSCMTGDATLFSRSDLVEAAWRIAQPILDVWDAAPPDDFPNYPAGSWGPKAASDMLARDGREWVEIVNRDLLERVPIFQNATPSFLRKVALTLQPVACGDGDAIVTKGDVGNEMYFVCRGQVEVLDGSKRLNVLGPGDHFGELALLHARPRNASVRAIGPCDIFALSKTDFLQALGDHPGMAASIHEIARSRYGIDGEL